MIKLDPCSIHVPSLSPCMSLHILHGIAPHNGDQRHCREALGRVSRPATCLRTMGPQIARLSLVPFKVPASASICILHLPEDLHLHPQVWSVAEHRVPAPCLEDRKNTHSHGVTQTNGRERTQRAHALGGAREMMNLSHRKAAHGLSLMPKSCWSSPKPSRKKGLAPRFWSRAWSFLA